MEEEIRAFILDSLSQMNYDTSGTSLAIPTLAQPGWTLNRWPSRSWPFASRTISA